jgi:hypothetical protein
VHREHTTGIASRRRAESIRQDPRVKSGASWVDGREVCWSSWSKVVVEVETARLTSRMQAVRRGSGLHGRDLAWRHGVLQERYS